MYRNKARVMVVWVVLGVLVGGTVYQTYDYLLTKSTRHDASKLLYQVSLFQMELLHSYLDELMKSEQTGQFQGAKLAAYSAAYTHERVVLAFGEDRITRLDSLSELLQFIVRLQIGEQRPLRESEAEVIRKAGEHFAEMYETYGQLLTSTNAVISSQNSKLQKADAELTDYLRKKRLN